MLIDVDWTRTVRQTLKFHDGFDELVVNTEQDVSDVLKNCADLRSEGQKTKEGSMGKHVAEIPLVLIQHWNKEWAAKTGDPNFNILSPEHNNLFMSLVMADENKLFRVDK